MILECFGQPEATSDKPTPGPDPSDVLMVFNEFKLVPRDWAVCLEASGCPPGVSDKPTLGPNRSAVLENTDERRVEV